MENYVLLSFRRDEVVNVPGVFVRSSLLIFAFIRFQSTITELVLNPTIILGYQNDQYDQQDRMYHCERVYQTIQSHLNLQWYAQCSYDQKNNVKNTFFFCFQVFLFFCRIVKSSSIFVNKSSHLKSQT